MTAVFVNDLLVAMTTQTLIFLKQSYSIISSVLVHLGLILSNNSLLLVKLSPTLGDGEFVSTPHARPMNLLAVCKCIIDKLFRN